MAVSVAKNVSSTLLEKIGIPKEYLLELEVQPTLKYESGVLHFQITQHSYLFPVSIPIPESTLTLVESGKLGVASLESLRQRVLKALLAYVPCVYPLPELIPIIAVAKKEAAGKKDKNTLKSMLYQSVQGSSPSSIYFIMGVATLEGDPPNSQSLTLSARFKNEKLSIRINCDLLNHVNIAKKINACGLESKAPTYASIHLNCISNTQAAMALGAIMAGLGVEWETDIPSIDKIAGKGA